MTMDTQERQDLAQHLAEMTYKRARREVRKLDPNAVLRYWRNSVGPNYWHTMYVLPGVGLKVTLIEEHQTEPIKDSHLVRANPVYVEARVEAWSPPA